MRGLGTSPRRDLPETRVHPSLTRAVLVAGVEREVAIPLVGIVGILLFAFRPNALTPTLAAIIVLVVFPRRRRLAKRDPQAYAVLKKHVRVAGFYRAQGRHGEPRRPLGRSL